MLKTNVSTRKFAIKLTQSVSFTDTLNDYEVRKCTSRGNVRIS